MGVIEWIWKVIGKKFESVCVGWFFVGIGLYEKFFVFVCEEWDCWVGVVIESVVVFVDEWFFGVVEV